MQSLTLPLVNGAQVTGLRHLPPRSASSLPRPTPLIVGLHGSSYDCHYFDADSSHTASLASSALGVPFVAIDRPCYGGTTSVLPVPEDSSFPQETGSWLHRYILPAIWSQFGAPNNCTCIVLLCHSLGAMEGIIAAAMHGQDPESQSRYPLGGIIVSGIGDKLLPEMEENPVHASNMPPDHHVSFPLDVKDALMFRPGTVNPVVLQLTEQLNNPAPLAEIDSLRKNWIGSWREEWASRVRAPVMFGLAEQDCFFEGTEEQVSECVAAFSRSVRAEGSLVRNAPHCMELSYWSQGWYARCFGFAVECAVSLAVAG